MIIDLPRRPLPFLNLAPLAASLQLWGLAAWFAFVNLALMRKPLNIDDAKGYLKLTLNVYH